MLPLLPLRETLYLFAIVFTFGFLCLLAYRGQTFRSRVVQGLAIGFPTLIVTGLVMWGFGTAQVAWYGVTLSWTMLILFAPLVAVLPFAILTHWSLKRAEPESPARRALLRGAVTALPASAIFASSRGLASGDEPARIVRVPMQFPNLPAALDGFRILHLSDLHLGAGRSVRDLELLLAKARAEKPDLIALTGDFADKLDELTQGLDVVADFPAPYGACAALGNHEYLSNIERTLPIYEQSRVRLLRGASECLSVRGAKLFIAGVDDPILRGPARRVFAETVPECATAAPGDAFRLLLCHRPEGFEAAARSGFHLTLSGHTHGGQVGILGKSLFEVLFGAPYMWGSYKKGESRLYTTSGFGHWFPFRLNCPAEAPLIVLERA